jgi:glycerol-3-phosphate dehydrogenase (NAD(P)+)
MDSIKSNNVTFNTSALVVGAGAFGTSMAFVLSQNFKRVFIKVRSQDIFEEIKQGENHTYLPGQKVTSNMIPWLSWPDLQSEEITSIKLIVLGLPTSAIHSFFQNTENFNFIHELLKKGISLICLSKGIDSQTLELPDAMCKKYFQAYADQLLYLSGPSFAKEILDKQITLVSLAGKSRSHLLAASQMTQTDFFKCFPTYDIKGVLLGGALKNVLAIASGIIEGLGYNHNTRAAMITRGIVEMLRFGVVYNARPETFYGFSGMGDLILTSTGELSRNKSFGMEIAKGKKAQDLIQASRSVVEGYKTTKAAYELAQKYEIRARLFEGMYKVLYENFDPRLIITEMMKLPAKFEQE